MRPPLEVADIFRQCGNDFRLTHTLSPEQRRVMRAIERCRTAALGGHVEQCDTCGHQRISYNSCRNRHCPKCQSLAKARWLEARLADLLPVEYFHVVFTLPEQLASVALQN
jgi:predicted Zn-ribbon and HTH transcriptional regulator